MSKNIGGLFKQGSLMQNTIEGPSHRVHKIKYKLKLKVMIQPVNSKGDKFSLINNKE
jgi:hypothetical protein